MLLLLFLLDFISLFDFLEQLELLAAETLRDFLFELEGGREDYLCLT